MTRSPALPLPPLTLAGTVTLARLRESWQATLWRDPRPGPDGETVQVFALQAEARLEALHAQVQAGEYAPRPAWRVWVPRENAAPRGVVALSVTDRIVEGALLRGLRPRLEGDLSDASYAYRQGLGALQAVQHLMQDTRRGWALRGDIAECFDSIPHAPLRASLQAVLGPDVDALLHALLTRPVRDRTGTYHVRRGLCQGSLLAPLLSNWYLDPFDRQLSDPGLNLVRYADDFVILTDSPQRAGECAGRVGAALDALGLKLNERKTRIVPSAEGFDFLGFHFRAGDVRIASSRLEDCRTELRALLAPVQGAVHPAHLRAANDLIRGWQAYYRLGNVRLDLEVLDEWLAAEYPHLSLARFLPAQTPRVDTYRLVRRGRARRTQQADAPSKPDAQLAQAALLNLVAVIARHPHTAFHAASLVARREASGTLDRGATRVALHAAYQTVYGAHAVPGRLEALELLTQDARDALTEAGAPRATAQGAAPLLAELLLPSCFDAHASPLLGTWPLALRWPAHMDTVLQGVTTHRVLLHREAHRLASALQRGEPYQPWTQP